MSISLYEQTFTEDARSRIDRDAGVIRGVKILGKISKNGRAYSDNAMIAAIPLYEGAQVNLDHPEKGEEWKTRGLMESVGWLTGVHHKDDGLYGDFNYVKSHPAAEMILERTERNPRGFGMSHVAKGRYGKTRDRVIEVIESVQSVDLVGCPATTAGLFESVEEKSKMKMTLKSLVESHGSAGHKTNLKAFLDSEKPDDNIKSVLESEFEMEEPEEGAEFSSLLTESCAALAVKSMKADATPEEKGAAVKSIGMVESLLVNGPPKEEPTPGDDELSRLREEVERHRNESRARDLLEAAGIAPKKYQVAAVAALKSPSERDELIESFKGQASGALPEKSPGKKPESFSWEKLKELR